MTDEKAGLPEPFAGSLRVIDAEVWMIRYPPETEVVYGADMPRLTAVNVGASWNLPSAAGVWLVADPQSVVLSTPT